jgi:hypothetical protein
MADVWEVSSSEAGFTFRATQTLHAGNLFSFLGRGQNDKNDNDHGKDLATSWGD